MVTLARCASMLWVRLKDGFDWDGFGLCSLVFFLWFVSRLLENSNGVCGGHFDSYLL